MNSLSYSIEQFEFAMCAYSEQWDDLGMSTWCLYSLWKLLQIGKVINVC